ncbi:hypothetical protein GF312_02100 [Candidatus Poribacteria bacterium]|nr:hypothetical protein [Candidatus Poribacteria bacterium]
MIVFALTPSAPREYQVETFNSSESIWMVTDDLQVEAFRYTSDRIRDSVMQFTGLPWTFGDSKTLGDSLNLDDSPGGCGEGVYRDYEVTAGLSYTFSCLYKIDSGKLVIQIHDLTNEEAIVTVSKDEMSWSAYEVSIKITDGCDTIRVKFLQDFTDPSPGPFYIDDVSLRGSVIMSDPDRYSILPEKIGSIYETIIGRRVYDLQSIHYSFYLCWEFLSEEHYNRLRECYKNTDILYFDDGRVPPLTEKSRCYDNALFTYEGITNPSNTNKAYSDSSNLLPYGRDDFEAAEFSTQEYGTIDDDDGDYKETNNPPTDHYIYHKFLIQSSISRDNVERIRFRVVNASSDMSNHNLDGSVLYAWNGIKWVELSGNTNNSITSLSFNTSSAEIAKQFVASDDGYIRLLLRSRNSYNGYDGLIMRTYFVGCEINQGLNLTVPLSNKAILDDNDDIIWVKNLTQGTTLSIGTDYTISCDRYSVEVFDQVSGDEIEVKYNRYYEVMFASMPESWLNGVSDNGNRMRDTEIILKTIK